MTPISSGSDTEQQADAREYEKGVEALGRWLGFNTKPPNPRGADSVWWCRPQGDSPVYVIFEAKSSEQAAAEHTVDRSSLDQLDNWKRQEEHALAIPGDAQVYLVRVGRRKELVSRNIEEAEKAAISKLAHGKSLLHVDEILQFAERLVEALQRAYQQCMKQPGPRFAGDSQKVSKALCYFADEKRVTPRDFILLVERNTFDMKKAAGKEGSSGA